MKKFIFLSILTLLLALNLQAKLNDHRIRVSCIGNSITYGTGLQDPVKDSYPSQLQQLLGTEYEVGRFGRPGATLLNRAFRPYMQQKEFTEAMNFAGDIAVIHLGINDTDPRAWSNYRDDFVHDYSALIDSVRKANPNCRVLVARMTPLSDRHHRFLSGTRDWHAQIQQAIETVARIKGCELIDFYEALHCRPDLFPDAIHPNKEGYGIMAQIVYSAITGDYGGLQLPAYYTDNMVLPRNRSFTISGKANAGEEVTLTIGSQKKKATTNHLGRWEIVVDPLTEGEEYTLTAKATSCTLTLQHVAVGELWLCSGQSNMQFRLEQCSTATEDIAKATNNKIRLLDLKGRWDTNNQKWSSEALEQTNRLQYFADAAWQPCTPENAALFSAIGYHFARELQDSLQCPIGVICNAVGGSGIEAWIDRTTIEFDMPAILKDWTTNDYLQDWVRGRAKENMGDSCGALQRHPYQPCYLYEASIARLKDLPINGVIWYQGESNAHCVESHEQLSALLLKSWRKTWDNAKLPFYYVQLSSLNRPSWTWFRDSQRRLMQPDNHVCMAVSSDCGDPNDVHPKDKRPIGHRLALWALFDNYHHNNLTPSGPLVSDVDFRADEAIIHFQYADGLHASSGDSIETVELAGEDGLFYPAHAEVYGNTLRAWSDRVKNPVLVRYGWQPYTSANLVNGANLPASTFRMEKNELEVHGATMNVRYENSGDTKKGNGWKLRKGRVAAFVRQQDLDLIGMQEVLHGQAKDLQELLPEYSMIGVGRENGKTKGEYAPVWYKSARFEEKMSGHFWLSQTPTVAGSLGWDAACTRIATWAILTDKVTHKYLFILNTHLDHVGSEARREGAKLILKRAKELAGMLPVMVTGDLNVTDRSEAYRILTGEASMLQDARKVTDQNTGVDYTWHGFGKLSDKEREKIDYIFVNDKIKVISTDIPEPDFDAMASDHCFHTLRFTLE